jgi:hypothetical protein
VVASLTAAWSDGAPFTGTLSFGPPNYSAGGVYALDSNNNLIIKLSGSASAPPAARPRTSRSTLRSEGPNMRRILLILLPLFATLLAPTDAWEASVSQNILITITAAQPVSFTPSSLTFASQNVGTTSPPQTVTITNISGAPLPIYDVSTRVTVGDAYSSDFAENGACVGTLAVGGACQVAVTFTPQAAGTRTAVLQFEATSTSPIYSIPLTGTGVTPTVSAFYVATNGSDSNPGTLAAPFATLGECQSAMRGSSTVKTCFVRGGTYGMSSSFTLTSADNGETWQYYPPDGVTTPVLDFGPMPFDYSTSPSTNAAAILIQGGNNITWNGFTIQAPPSAGIEVQGGPAYFDIGPVVFPATGNAYNNTVINNIVQNGTFTPCAGGACAPFMGWYPGIGVTGATQGTVVTHNVVHDVGGAGISLTDTASVGGPTGGLNNTEVSYNVVYNAPLRSTDAGAIYIYETTATVTGVSFSYNYIWNFAGSGQSNTHGIYLDDGASKMTLQGNVVAPSTNSPDSALFFVHGGDNNLARGNIIDLLANTNETLMQYAWDGLTSMQGNAWESNIIVLNSGSANNDAYFGSYFGPGMFNPTIENNAYWNYGPGGISSGGNIGGNGGTSGGCTPQCGDQSPTTVSPAFANSVCYELPSNSPVYNGPVSFPPQPANWGKPGFWGPPGYVVTGSSPSMPHSGSC